MSERDVQQPGSMGALETVNPATENHFETESRHVIAATSNHLPASSPRSMPGSGNGSPLLADGISWLGFGVATSAPSSDGFPSVSAREGVDVAVPAPTRGWRLSEIGRPPDVLAVPNQTPVSTLATRSPPSSTTRWVPPVVETHHSRTHSSTAPGRHGSAGHMHHVPGNRVVGGVRVAGASVTHRARLLARKDEAGEAGAAVRAAHWAWSLMCRTMSFLVAAPLESASNLLPPHSSSARALSAPPPARENEKVLASLEAVQALSSAPLGRRDECGRAARSHRRST